MSRNPWTTEVVTFKRQMAVWLQAKVRDRGLGLRSRLYAGSVCDDSATETLQLCMRYINEPNIYLF